MHYDPGVSWPDLWFGQFQNKVVRCTIWRGCTGSFISFFLASAQSAVWHTTKFPYNPYRIRLWTLVASKMTCPRDWTYNFGRGTLFNTVFRLSLPSPIPAFPLHNGKVALNPVLACIKCKVSCFLLHINPKHLNYSQATPLWSPYDRFFLYEFIYSLSQAHGHHQHHCDGGASRSSGVGGGAGSMTKSMRYT